MPPVCRWGADLLLRLDPASRDGWVIGELLLRDPALGLF